jgi:hypothetical protein
MIRWTIPVIAAMAVALPTACGNSHSLGTAHRKASSQAQDCAELMRFRGVDYTEGGFANSVGPLVGTAIVSACRDNGFNNGPTFESGQQVQIFSVANVASSVAIAERVAPGTYKVFVAPHVSQKQLRILDRAVR